MEHGERAALIARLAEFPQKLRETLAGVSGEGLSRSYRAGGWTVRQLIHHLADAQMNFFVRTKLLLTEEKPTIKPFDQVSWAELADCVAEEIEPSLLIIEGVHERLATLFSSLRAEEWTRTGMHPERGEIKVETILTFLTNHSEHHLEQIKKALQG